MATVTATTTRRVEAPAERVLAALADYRDVRPRLLPEQFTGYGVLEGGTGAGTVARWELHATKKRVRSVVADVSAPDAVSLVERDRNSTLTTTWRVVPAGAGASEVVVTTTWQGAGGVGGFFERTFAPRGLDRIYARVLEGLAREVAGR
ncbi:SRPBCC family protein [Kineococcus glutinatus]|uniref:SRPBCC family protein n=1 Tax=Kineococcus glutinatus TaxID=1070872 RepID=A0ABP8VFU6_9ACTN